MTSPRSSARTCWPASPADVLAEIQQIARTLPVNPLILRAGWPDMDPDWFVSYLDELGTRLVPGIAEIEPCRRPGR